MVCDVNDSMTRTIGPLLKEAEGCLIGDKCVQNSAQERDMKSLGPVNVRKVLIDPKPVFT